MSPRPLIRLGRTTYTLVSGPAGQLDLTDTVLHQLACPGECPVLHIRGRRIAIPPLPRLQPRTLFSASGAPMGTAVSLPPDLAALDSCISVDIAGSEVSELHYREVLRQLARLLEEELVHFPMDPGLMRFCIGDDGQLGENEVGISVRDARRLFVDILRGNGPLKDPLLYRIEQMESIKHRVLLKLMLAQIEDCATPVRDVPLRYGRLLDGAEVFALRYPVHASRTSAMKKRLRVYLHTPVNGMFFPPEALIKHHQGDCDGDRGFIAVLGFGETPPAPLRWKPALWDMADPSPVEALMSQPLPETPDPVVASKEAAVRGDYIGLLTCSIWILGYAAAYHHQELGYLSPEDVWPEVLDFATPLIEGVMDARKGYNGPVLADLVLQTFSGRLDVNSLCATLPVCAPEENTDKKFKPEQLERFRHLLMVISGGTGVVRLGNPHTGASQDEVVRQLIVRGGNLEGIGRLADTLGSRLGNVVWQSIFCKTRFPYIPDQEDPEC